MTAVQMQAMAKQISALSSSQDHLTVALIGIGVAVVVALVALLATVIRQERRIRAVEAIQTPAASEVA